MIFFGTHHAFVQSKQVTIQSYYCTTVTCAYIFFPACFFFSVSLFSSTWLAHRWRFNQWLCSRCVIAAPWSTDWNSRSRSVYITCTLGRIALCVWGCIALASLFCFFMKISNQIVLVSLCCLLSCSHPPAGCVVRKSMHTVTLYFFSVV